VLPHWDTLAAKIVGLIEPDVNGVVVAPTVDEPEPVTVNEPGTSNPASTGPTTTGHVTTAVTRVHNCGASPTAITLPVTLIEPEAPGKSTRNWGV
jgi:hypothetical protein